MIPTVMPLASSPVPVPPLDNGGSRRVGRVAARMAVVILLVLAANVWAAGFVAAERYIYAWDWATYWLMFQHLGALLRTDAPAALAEIRTSIAASESNVLPVLPLMPFALIFGPGRLSFILGIVNAVLLPSIALMALVVDRVMERRSWPRLLLCAAGLLTLHVIWAPALRGFADAMGVAIACVILLLYVRRPAQQHRPLALVGMGLLFCLLILTRRYYLFWAVAFFPAALLAFVLGTPGGRNRRAIVAVARSLSVIGIACAAGLLILATPLVVHIATTDYSVAYAAYRSDLVGRGPVGQVVDHFGIALLTVCAGGLGCLVARRDTRQLGVLLSIQVVLAFALFTHVQTLFGVHHYDLLVPAAGIGIAALIATCWSAALRTRWRIAGVAGVLAIVLLSAAAVFSPSPIPAGPLMPRVRYAPLVRSDLGEIRRLFATLAALHPHRVYVAASSQLVNWSVFAMGCREMQPDLCAHIAVTQDIDTRDGFPRGILDADYVLLATPTQYHVRPADQQVVGRVARDIRDGRGIGASFQRLPGSFGLAGGATVTIHRRIAPLRSDAVKALGADLLRRYPGMTQLFTPPGL